MKSKMYILFCLLLTVCLSGCGSNRSDSDLPTFEMVTEGTETVAETTSVVETTEETSGETLPTEHCHEWTATQVKPTCTEDGYTSYACSCGESYRDAGAGALGHAWGQWKTLRKATVSAEGRAERSCSRCGKKETKTLGKVIGAQHTHSFTKKVTMEATCTRAGVRTCTCSCGESYTEEIARRSHSYADTIVAASCTAKGYTVHTCRVCGNTYRDGQTAEKGHTFGKWTVTKQPTETEAGLEERVCSVCKTKESRTLNKLAHVHTYTDVVTAPTCTAKGYTTHTCTGCKTSYTDAEVAAKGHTFGKWAVTRQPSETETGLEERVCSACKTKESRTLDRLAHVHTYTDVVTAPTCTAKGYTTHTCIGCKSSYTDAEVAAKGHTFGKWTVTKQPSETETGLEERVCSVCKTKESRTLDKLAHVHQYSESVTKDATCATQGEKQFVCSCGHSYSEPISAKGHDWSDWKTILAPTAEAAGTAARNCKSCSATETKALDKLPANEHSWKLVDNVYRVRQFAVCPHCDAYLCELDGSVDPNDALWAHIDATDGLWYNHSWANDVEYILVEPAKWVCTQCGAEKPFEG